MAALLAVGALRLAGPVWRVVHPTWLPLFAILATGLLLLGTGQGAELAVGLAELPAAAVPLFVGSAGFLAVQVWHSTRFLLDAKYGTARERADMPRVVTWLPRAYGLAVLAIAAGALLAAMARVGPLAALLWALAGVAGLAAAFAVLVTRRRGLAARAEVLLAAGKRLGPRLAREIHSDPVDRTAPRRERLRRQAPLSRQLIVLWAVVAVATFLLVALRPIEFGRTVGAATVVMAGLGTWVAAATLLRLVPRRPRRLLVLAALGASLLLPFLLPPYHQIRRTNPEPWLTDPRPTLAEAVATLPSEPREGAPAIFVAVAGGGLRAAYWSASILAHLADRRPAAKDRLVALSGSSGGSLGLAAFMAVLAEDRRGRLDRSFAEAVDAVLSADFLSSGLAAMLHTDALGLVAWDLFRTGGRGVVMEEAWAASWERLRGPLPPCGPGVPEACNPLAGPYLDLWRAPAGNRALPVTLLNATLLESGRRLVASNIVLSPRDYAEALDTQALARGDIRAAAAAHDSARFAYLGPAAALPPDPEGERPGHVVDGGYVDNSGATSLQETAAATLRVLAGRRFRPVVVQVTSEPGRPSAVLGDGAGPCEIAPSPRALEGAAVPLRDLAAPLQALMATRVGREETAIAELARWAGCNEAGWPADMAPIFVELAMCEEEGFDVPLGWVMAEPSRAAIRRLLEPGSCNGEALAVLDRLLAAP